MWNRGYPLSLLTAFAASSPKGTPLHYAGNFIATAKSRPLGEGGLPRSGKTEGENSLSQNLTVLPAPSERKANPLSLLTAFAASSPEGGSFWHLPVSTNKAPPSGELARRKP